MSRNAMVAAVFLAFCLGTHLCNAQERSAENQDETKLPQAVSTHEVNLLIEKRLRTPVKLDFEDKEFRFVIHAIRQQAKITVYLDQSAIDAGLGPDDLVSIDFDGISLASALKLFLNKYDCTYFVEDEVVQICTSDELDARYLTKVFRCQDLIEKFKSTTIEIPYFAGKRIDKNYRAVPAASNNKVSTKTAPAQDFGQRDERPKVFGATLQDPSRNNGYFVFKKRLSPDEHLVHVIKSMVATESWDDADGKASMLGVNGILVVRHNGETMHQINKLLDILRSELKTK